LQSRIASGSQAARCFGVHCCAAAGKDANVSARPKAAERPVPARRFNLAMEILILESPFTIRFVSITPLEVTAHLHCRDAETGFTEAALRDPVKQGAYLVTLGHCMECHSAWQREVSDHINGFGKGGRRRILRCDGSLGDFFQVFRTGLIAKSRKDQRHAPSPERSPTPTRPPPRAGRRRARSTCNRRTWRDP
jgi:hypothetical protein